MLFSTLNIKKLNQKGNILFLLERDKELYKNNDKERKMKSNASWTEGLLFMSFFSPISKSLLFFFLNIF